MDTVLRFIIGNEFILFTLFAVAVFVLAYVNTDRILSFLHKKSLGNREEVLRLMDLMFVDMDKKRVTLAMLLISFGLGAVVFLVVWPNIILGLIFASAVTVAGWSIPKLLITSIYEKRCTKVTDQMVDGLTIMGNGIKAGLSITQSMERVTENMKGPIAQD